MLGTLPLSQPQSLFGDASLAAAPLSHARASGGFGAPPSHCHWLIVGPLQHTIRRTAISAVRFRTTIHLKSNLDATGINRWMPASQLCPGKTDTSKGRTHLGNANPMCARCAYIRVRPMHAEPPRICSKQRLFQRGSSCHLVRQDIGVVTKKEVSARDSAPQTATTKARDVARMRQQGCLNASGPLNGQETLARCA